MSEGPKRFSLSDYQSQRGLAKPAESAVLDEQKSELEELHMLLGTGVSPGGLENGSDMLDVLRTPGASPDTRDMAEENEEGEEVEASDHGRSSRRRRSEKKSSKENKSSHRHSRRSRRSTSPRSRSRTPSRSRRRSRARSVSRSRSRSSDRRKSRSRSRSHHRRRGRRSRDSRRHRSKSQSRSRSRMRSRSQSADKVSMRCVFPYEDGGIIIGLRGAHLSKLRRAVQAVDWRISNETNDRQDRILVVRGTIGDIAKAFCELAEHFISQGMYVDYPPQTRGRGSKEVDVSRPFIPIRLLMPHKTCGAIIGQKSETLINTRINCAARRVYVYRERIADSRERVVEVVGTPKSIARVMEVLGEQVARTLTNDQAESDLYIPERDGLRKFLSKQGVPRSRVSLESLKSSNSDKSTKDTTEATGSSSRKNSERKRSRSRSRSVSRSQSPANDRSNSRSRSRDQGRHRRSSRRHRRHSHSRSQSRSESRSRRKRHSSKQDRDGRHSSRHTGRHRRSRSRDSESSRSASESRSPSRSRNGRSSKRRKSRGVGREKSETNDRSNHESVEDDHPMDTSPDSNKLNGSGMSMDSAVGDSVWTKSEVSVVADQNAISGGSW
ncbi:RNA binding protein, heterogenous nuclear RNP-K like protein [Coemansia sp. RSA 2131]|nr:RNA binding protein, heterogenous nuclear RNP-K like protein [Coemansia sp. RSA 2131]